MSTLVTVKVSGFASELAVATSYLEDHGIQCFIKDELINQAYAVGTSPFGGVKLQVPEEDAEKARLLLVEGGFAKKEDYEPTKSDLWLMQVIEKIQSFFKRS